MAEKDKRENNLNEQERRWEQERKDDRVLLIRSDGHFVTTPAVRKPARPEK
jgi:hypothetical protein